jgi:glycosyltransferase involved in cell wall biosynthesis
MNSLTIAITSYNRPRELRRCIESLLPLPDGVEVLVSDDCSPKLDEIRAAISDLVFPAHSVFLSESAENIGYDANVLRTIELSKTSHVMLLSDDDLLEPGCVDSARRFVVTQDPAVAFVRFGKYRPGLVDATRPAFDFDRNFSRTTHFSVSDVMSRGAVLYSAILFSGLVFRRAPVLEHGAVWERFARSIYVQVAIFMTLASQHGCWFLSGPGVLVGGDGENGFGLNSAAVGQSDLADRGSVLSRLRYHKRLFVVIHDLAELISPSVEAVFFKEYHVRAIAAFAEARNINRKMLSEYWKTYREITPNVPLVNSMAFTLLWILPTSAANALLSVPARLLRSRRGRQG